MTEWVPSSWDAVKTGDRGSRVQIHRPTGFIEGTLEHRDAESVLIGFAAGQERGLHSTRFYRRDGWNLFVPAPTTPELPVEIQSVVSWWQGGGRGVAMRVNHGWHVVGLSMPYSDEGLLKLIGHNPFVKLEPVATTAKAVLQRIEAVSTYNYLASGDKYVLPVSRLLEVAAEFGVS